METVLEVENVEKYYGTRSNITKALGGVSFRAQAGEFVGIMGASGSGKTTLLSCISTIDRVTAGTIRVGGRDITKQRGSALTRFRREELGFLFQDFNLLDTLTARENIALALTIRKLPAREILERTEAIAGELGITDVLEKFPYQMSGGQKQRVAAARAVIGNPKLALADEPTGALDSRSARQLLAALEYLNRERGTTILMVTHDAFTASYANRILFLKDGRLFSELLRGEQSRKEFFARIIEVQTVLGGEI